MTALKASTAPPEDFAALDRQVRNLYRTGWVVIAVAVLIAGFIAHQLVLTSWLARANQNELEAAAESRFAAVEITEVLYPPPLTAEPTSPQGDGTPEDVDAQPRRGTLLVEPLPAASEAFAIITAPTLPNLREGWTVVEGVGSAQLRTGAGHLPTSPLPGMPGNAVISGHRTTYGAPFNQLDELSPGDLVKVKTATGVHTYVVRQSIVVDPREVWVAEHRDGAWLTLTTCHPEFSARQRLVVFAELAGGPNWEAIYR